VSTRKLILLALACGLAILIAGSVQLLRIERNETSTLGVGDSTQLATVTARVTSGATVGDAVRVVVHLTLSPSASAPLEGPIVGWSLLTGGLKRPVEAVTAADTGTESCADTVLSPGEEADCLLAFPVSPGVEGTTYVTFAFAGASATWRLGI